MVFIVVIIGAGASDHFVVVYRTREVSDEREWADLFTQIMHPSMVQSWAFGEGKRAEGWRPRRMIIERQATPVAIYQVLERRMGIRVVSRINRGPLLLSGDDVEGVYRTIRREWRFLLGGLLFIAPALLDEAEHAQMLRGLGFRWRGRGWSSGYLDLSVPSEQLRKGLAAKWRNQLNSSERRLDLRISQEPEQIDGTIQAYLTTQQERHFHGNSERVIRRFIAAAKSDLVIVQGWQDDHPVGGAAIIRYGNTGEPYIGWSSVDGRKANVGNLLIWHGAMEMQRRGCTWYDVGSFVPNRDDGYHHFKAGMNPLPYQMVGEWITF